MTRESAAAVLFAFARTAFCIYRAATQSIAADEAFSYISFLNGPWLRLYDHYDANNHLLYSILAKLSAAAFHPSEFTLRLPSLVAGFFLTFGIYKLLEAATISRAVRWPALIALSLHPLMLDFSIAARGYSLALALLVWAMLLFLRNRDGWAGLLLGLGISANLTIAFPGAGLILCPLILRKGAWRERLWTSFETAIVAATVVLAICYASIVRSTPGNFYVGNSDLSAALFNLLWTSLRDSFEHAGLFGTPDRAHWIYLWIVPVIAIFIAAASGVVFVREPKRRPELAPVLILIVSMIGLISAHYAAGLNYPIDRLGLYLILLFGLSWAIGADAVGRMIPATLFVHGALAALLIVQLITQLETRYFQIWRYDMPSREIARKLEQETRGKPAESVRLSVTWYQQPALEFYRQTRRISALQPVQRFEKTPLEGFDYYVLNLKEDETVRGRDINRLNWLFGEPVSGVLLAKEP